jgi:hypothetical protein
MKVGIVDVGSNTVRLLVASIRDGGLAQLQDAREHLFLIASCHALISPPSGKVAGCPRARELSKVSPSMKVPT